MALPTLPGYWTSRKNIYEQAIVRRRYQESDYREKWSQASDYFHKTNVEANQKQAWSSDQSFQHSMDAYKSLKEKEEKEKTLIRRRRQLTELYAYENKKYAAELRGYSTDNYDRLDCMRDRADQLKSAREENRKRLAEEKLYEHWRQNNHDIREVESSLLKDHVIEKWSDQLAEQREQEEREQAEKLAFEEKLEEERLAALERERQISDEKLDEEIRLKQVLKEQIAELRRREHEAKLLKAQQEQLQREQWELEQLEEERRQKEQARKKQEFARILLRQHKAQMLRRSRQIQEELEQDMKLLQSLIDQGIKQDLLHSARQERARADAAWMKQVVEEQLRVEKAREAELDLLYQDEAARMWQKREAEWEKEKQARERLMQEVLESRQQQICVKLDELHRRQVESLEQREQLVREMDIANQLTRRDQEEQEAAKEVLKLNLKEQMTSRKECDEVTRLRLREELEEEKKMEEEYEDVLRQETERMRLRGYSPRIHARRQAWM
ncbi:trichoplein keratin filament-binding protein-like [Gigantopelta aegis]|uniref:trichoplein keratin filament-binding protein-like n=1 Tax=Gigantopelta aegis TaxID=1735272 RepID=UPI001B88CC79|nr:trichoplein keratin filament-binding protein-like [Gigantopelta aegis]